MGDTDSRAPSSDEQNGTALRPHRLWCPVIEMVDQLRMKSDSNTHILHNETCFKNVAKPTAFMGTMCFMGVARCPALCPPISMDGCLHGCLLCKNTFMFLVHKYRLYYTVCLHMDRLYKKIK